MPQLALNGLSENWVLRECGVRHWSALRKLLSTEGPEITDRRGRRLLPAFIACRVSCHDISAFHEGDSVNIATLLRPVSHMRYLSRTEITSDSGSMEVQLLTSFLRHAKAGDNLSLTTGKPTVPEQPGTEDFQSTLPEVDDMLRSQKWDTYLEFPNSEAAQETFSYEPTPNTDFNGAGLLYFAQYQDIAERMEWRHHRNTEYLRHKSLFRELFFYSNANVGDVLEVQIHNFASSAELLRHRMRIMHGGGTLMAEVFTVKRS